MPLMHSITLLVLVIASLLFSFTMAHTSTVCNEDFCLLALSKNISQCMKLGTLGAELGWNYNNGTKNHSTIEIFFGARPSGTSGWVAWGINPTSRAHMIGTRALIGFQQPNGSLILKTYNITRETKMGCALKESKIDLAVNNQKIIYLKESGYLVISATMTLPLDEYDLTRLNHVWQVGSLVMDMEPQKHARGLENFDSAETIDLISGKVCFGAGYARKPLRKVHGALSVIGWGTLLPAGIIVARYFKEFPVKYKSWKALHVIFQIAAYTIGMIGWIIGIYLGHASKDYVFRIHRMIGIFVFVFATLQMMAIWLRPKETDEYRKYWNVYHHFLGYGLIPVIMLNIFHGVDILKVNTRWKYTYIGILGLFSLIILVLEVFTWTKHIRQQLQQRKRANDQ